MCPPRCRQQNLVTTSLTADPEIQFGVSLPLKKKFFNSNDLFMGKDELLTGGKPRVPSQWTEVTYESMIGITSATSTYSTDAKDFDSTTNFVSFEVQKDRTSLSLRVEPDDSNETQENEVPSTNGNGQIPGKLFRRHVNVLAYVQMGRKLYWGNHPEKRT